MEEVCTWCRGPMGKEKDHSANGNPIHKSCQDDFKSYFRKGRLEEITKVRLAKEAKNDE